MAWFRLAPNIKAGAPSGLYGAEIARTAEKY